MYIESVCFAGSLLHSYLGVHLLVCTIGRYNVYSMFSSVYYKQERHYLQI